MVLEKVKQGEFDVEETGGKSSTIKLVIINLGTNDR